jgi:hypothetical protein
MEIINEAKKIKFEQNDKAEEMIVMDESEMSNILADLEKPNNYSLKDSIAASFSALISDLEKMINKSKLKYLILQLIFFLI